MTKTNVSWPLFAALGVLGLGGALLAPACTVTSGDGDDIDVDAGTGGTSSSGGSKSSGGSAGTSAGSGGSSAGSGGSSAGSGGSSAGSGGSGGSGGGAQMYACEGDTVIPFPSCDPDNAGNECDECIQTSCCDLWRDCAATDETAGDFVCGWGGPYGNGELGCIIRCMLDGAADVTECSDCAASQWEMDPQCLGEGQITQATNDLLGCIADNGCDTACYIP